MSLPALVRLFPLFYFRFYVDKQNKAHIEFGTYRTFFRALIVFALWYSAQVPTSIIFVKKMAQRCGVRQIKRMTSQDKDQVLMKSNMLGFGGYSQMKF